MYDMSVDDRSGHDIRSKRKILGWGTFAHALVAMTDVRIWHCTGQEMGSRHCVGNYTEVGLATLLVVS